MNESIRAQLPRSDVWVQWAAVGLAAVFFGLQCQVLMIGAQGAIAQVMPVPGGRSIRGRPAVAAGWLLVAWFGFAKVTLLLGFEGIRVAAIVLGVLAIAALVGAILVYVWNLPAAVADFGSERRRSS